LKKLNDVAVHVFLFPLEMHRDAYGKSKKIWCAEDKVKALDDAVAGSALTDLKECEAASVVDDIKFLARKIGVRSTPTIILESGRIVRGYMAAPDLQREIDADRKKTAAEDKPSP
jgi:thiol:disulfide interchange protein DsbC